MVDASSSFIKQTHTALNALEQFFWPTAANIDNESMIHYIFKRVPDSVKNNQLNDWARLQVKTLSPFPTGDVYYFVSKLGLHAWFSLKPLSGIPETACQTQLPNGEHLVKGAHHLYKQVWSDGVLTHNIVLNSLPSTDLQAQDINTDSPWAVERKLQQALTKPKTTLWIATFAFVCCLIYYAVAYVTVNWQITDYANETETLQNELGEKLDTVTRMRQHQSGLQSLYDWNSQNGNLPATVAIAIDSVLLQSTWNARAILWQNKTLTIELFANNMDIAKLVAELERNVQINDVSIQPAGPANTWILEIEQA